MFKTHTYILVSLLLTGIVFSSCSEWLDLRPENKIIRQEFWKSKEDVQSAVIGCYASLEESENIARFIYWGELRGEFIKGGTGTGDRAKNIKRLIEGTIEQENDVFSWAAIYKTINLCNTVLKFAPDVLEVDETFTETELNYYKAEVLTIRSLMYFLLVRSFKDVPLILKATVTDEDNVNVPMAREEAILDTIVNDLKFATQYTRETFGNVLERDRIYNKARVTKYAVYALLADIYLWRNQYQECISACDVIIKSGKFSLLPTMSWFTENFYNEALSSTEVIWQLPFIEDDGQTPPFYNWFSTSKDKQFLASELTYELWDVDTVQYRFPYTTNLMVNKYMGKPNSTSTRGSSDFATLIYYRYPDVMLMKAEALIETGILNVNQEPIDFAVDSIIYNVRYREYVKETPPPSSIAVAKGDAFELEKLLLDERAREFAFEGKRWFDLLRLTRRNQNKNELFINEMLLLKFGGGSLGSQLISKFSDPNSLFNPIYIKELESNTSLIQNPYYEKSTK